MSEPDIASVPLSEKIQAAVVRGACAFVAWFSLPVIQRLGTALGYLLWISGSRARKTTCINIGLCFPELSDAERETLARQSLVETGKTIMETGAFWNWSLEKCRRLIRHIEGEQLFVDSCADKRGLILLAPHLCAWEVLPSLLTQHTRYTAMYKPPKIRPLDTWIQDVRNRAYARVVPTNRRGVSELMKTLKAGGCVVVLPDQEPEREGGAFVPFFGVETLTISLVHGLATKTGAQLLEVNAVRLPHGNGFDVVFRDANAVNTPDLRESLTAMNAIIEAAVREFPAQYQWEYKRFKRRPFVKSYLY
ncbi:MAG TPA: lysophospholipid acyltransferase family protein [Pseudomonadales bacterium]|nr:lysophospholipid acyltransferase family protein [Pseudomonadales bacterium]